MSAKTLAAGVFAGFSLAVASIGPASAVPVITIDAVYARSAPNQLATAPFATVDFGTSAGSGFVTSTTQTINGVQFSFSGPNTGVFSGATSVSASPYGDDNLTRNYLSAGAGGTVTVNFGQDQTSLRMLWGTVDQGTTRNLFTGAGLETITGTQVFSAAQLAFCGANSACLADGQYEVYLTISGLQTFQTATFSDGARDTNAFEFNVAAVPELSTWGMMILGFFGVGFLGYRKSKASGAAFRMA